MLCKLALKNLELLSRQCPLGRNGGGVYKHSADENSARSSVDCEQGSRIDLFAPAPTPCLVTQVGHNTMLAFYKGTNTTGLLIYVQIMVQKKLILLLFPAG